MSRIPTILSGLALTVSLTGAGAFAAVQIDGSSIKNGTIGIAKLTPKAVKQLRGAHGDRGDRGRAGATGTAGLTGAAGPPGAPGLAGGLDPAKVTYVTGPSGPIPTGSTFTFTALCPPGSKVVGGGYHSGANQPFTVAIQASSSSPIPDGSGWQASILNSAIVTFFGNAYAVCVAP
jgi:hypothetical protein